MNTSHSTAPFSTLLLVISLGLTPLLRAEPAAVSHEQVNASYGVTGPRATGFFPRYSEKTAEEKEYEYLSLEFRKREAAFQDEWRRALPDQRTKLRQNRLREHPATFLRLNNLAATMVKNRKAAEQAELPETTPPSTGLVADPSIKDKSEAELRKIGLDIEALHKKESVKE